MTLAAAAGCQITPSELPENEVFLRIRPAQATITRAGSLGDVFPANQDLALWCYSLPSNLSWSENKYFAEMLADGEQYTCNPSDTLWFGNHDIQWTSDKHFSLFACSPSTLRVEFDLNDEVIIKGVDVSKSDEDILYASAMYNLDRADYQDYVPLSFEHALCKVDVRLKTSIEDVEYVITRIAMRNLYHCGTFYSASAGWATSGDTEPIELYHNEGGRSLPRQGYTSLGKTIMCIPQALDSLRFEFDYHEIDHSEFYEKQGKVVDRAYTKVTPIVTKTWQPGKYYTYTVEFRPEPFGLTFEDLSQSE